MAAIDAGRLALHTAVVMFEIDRTIAETGEQPSDVPDAAWMGLLLHDNTPRLHGVVVYPPAFAEAGANTEPETCCRMHSGAELPVGFAVDGRPGDIGVVLLDETPGRDREGRAVCVLVEMRTCLAVGDDVPVVADEQVGTGVRVEARPRSPCARTRRRGSRSLR